MKIENATDKLNVKENITECRLDNGLTVLIQEDHFAPVAALQVWVKVGAADELPGEEGLAHVLEHMLFKGTEKRATGEIAMQVEGAGGVINAWTSFDRTVFHIAIESGRFEEALEILSDAVGHSLIDEQELKNELEVIQEEIKRGKDSPEHRLFEELFDLALEGHPYHRPIIGTPESVASFTREKVLSFYRRWYCASNLTLVVCGDIKTDETIEMVKRHFASLPGRETVIPPQRGKPVQNSARARVVSEKLEEAHLALGWRIPGISDADIPALDLLGIALGQGDSSRVVHKLRREEGLVNDVIAYPYAGKDTGLFLVEANLPPDCVPEAHASILDEFRRVTLEPLERRELEKARTMLLSEHIYNTQTAEGKAQEIGHFRTLTGDALFYEKYTQVVEKITPEEIQAAAAKYFTDERLSTVVLWPENAEEAKPEVEDFVGEAIAPCTAPSESGITKDEFGIARIMLDNGVRLVVKEHRGVPLVATQAAVLAGLRFETPRNNGVNNLLGELLTLGTPDMSALQVAESIDSLAGTLEGFSGRNSLGLRSMVISRNFAPAFELLSKCLLYPAVSENELEREKELVIEEIKSRNDQPASVAFDLFSETLYKTHPFRMPVTGSIESVTGLTRNDILEYHSRHVLPEELVISIVGDISADKAAETVDKYFSGMKSKRADRPEAPELEPAPTEKRRASFKLPRQQSHLVIGFQGFRLCDTHDVYAYKLLDAILSGQGGRLFLELRDRQSLAYSLSFYSVPLIDPGFIAVYIGTSPDKLEKAEKGIITELDRLLQNGVSPDEMERARNYLIGSNAISMQKAGSQAGTQLFNELYGIGYNEHEYFKERILAINAEDLLASARRYIKLDAPVVVVVGP